MAHTDRRPRRRLVCYWCAEPLTLSIVVIAEDWVCHACCLEDQEADVRGPVCWIELRHEGPSAQGRAAATSRRSSNGDNVT